MTTSSKKTTKAPSSTKSKSAASGTTTATPPAAATADPKVVDTLSPVVVGNELRKKELFDLVVARSGMKKKDVKPVVEAMLAVLGDALSEHREMQLPPLGKLKVQRGKEMSDGRALVLKLRQKNAALNAKPSAKSDKPAKPATAAE
ncbi:HU family DNA-binding protein [Sulfitobacter sp. HNIBRBA3233]|uniref:HU family DNA-binding protein n=1 Tax=Sulfitobacter marinivivus TaxID=3158558 RepID=UPI0032DF110E